MWLIGVIAVLVILIALLGFLIPPGRVPPGPIINFTGRIEDMKSMHLFWGLPPVGPNQRALASVVIKMRTDPSFPFTTVATVPVTTTPPVTGDNVVIPDLADGDYEFSATTVDSAGVPAVPAFFSTTINEEFDPPGPVSGFIGVLE